MKTFAIALSFLFLTLQTSAHAKLIEISSLGEYQQEVIDAKVPVLVEFYASWCPHCENNAPDVRAIARDFGDTLNVILIESKTKAATYRQESSFPEFHVIDADGKGYHLTGEMPYANLARWIKSRTNATFSRD